MKYISKNIKTINISFCIFFFILAGLHLFTRLQFDEISLGLIAIGTSPLILPLLKDNFKSIEFFGIKAELIEKIEQQNVKLNQQEEQIKRQRKMIDEIVKYSMAQYYFEMLCDIGKCQKGQIDKYIFHKSSTERGLRYLRDNGFIHINRISDLTDGENIADKLTLTPIGELYINLRENV